MFLMYLWENSRLDSLLNGIQSFYRFNEVEDVLEDFSHWVNENSSLEVMKFPKFFE